MAKKICEIAIPVAIVGLPATRPTIEEKEYVINISQIFNTCFAIPRAGAHWRSSGRYPKYDHWKFWVHPGITSEDNEIAMVSNPL